MPLRCKRVNTGWRMPGGKSRSPATRCTGLMITHYSSTPQPPTDSELALWRQLSTVVGVSEDATGSTRVPALKNEQAQTTIEISLPYGAGSEPDARRIVFVVAELMARYRHPAQLTAHTGEGPAEIIVGGCYRHDAKHVRPAIEI
jgi:hypothetical protein